MKRLKKIYHYHKLVELDIKGMQIYISTQEKMR